MAFSYNWNDVYPWAWRPGGANSDGSDYKTSGYWGKKKAGNIRIVDREGMAAYYSDSPWRSQNYRQGNGNAAQMIQTLLNRSINDAAKRGQAGPGTGLLTTDGILGTKSDTAIKWYQARNGLEADGIVGNNTWQKLRYA